MLTSIFHDREVETGLLFGQKAFSQCWVQQRLGELSLVLILKALSQDRVQQLVVDFTFAKLFKALSITARETRTWTRWT